MDVHELRQQSIDEEGDHEEGQRDEHADRYERLHLLVAFRHARLVEAKQQSQLALRFPHAEVLEGAVPVGPHEHPVPTQWLEVVGAVGWVLAILRLEHVLLTPVAGVPAERPEVTHHARVARQRGRSSQRALALREAAAAAQRQAGGDRTRAREHSGPHVTQLLRREAQLVVVDRAIGVARPPGEIEQGLARAAALVGQQEGPRAGYDRQQRVHEPHVDSRGAAAGAAATVSARLLARFREIY